MRVETTKPLCTLHHAEGRVEPCPGPDRPFWADYRCQIAGLRSDLYDNAALRQFLLDLRVRMSEPGQTPGLLPPELR